MLLPVVVVMVIMKVVILVFLAGSGSNLPDCFHQSQDKPSKVCFSLTELD